jgi:hypothetical protein
MDWKTMLAYVTGSVDENLLSAHAKLILCLSPKSLVDVLPRHKCRGFHSAPPSPIEGSGDAEEDSWTLGH